MSDGLHRLQSPPTGGDPSELHVAVDSSDAELLARFAQTRDEAAFELLVWRHGTMVLSACRRVLRHTEDAEDAFQAAFLILARKAASVSRGTALPAWLHRVVAEHFASNPASGRVMQKLGLTYEGTLRRHFNKWGEFLDVAVYGILEPEWRAKQRRSFLLPAKPRAAQLSAAT